MPYQITHPDACQSSGLTCPLTKDDGPYNYTTTLPISKKFPRIKLDVKWELNDENDKNIVCVLIPTRIK
ncbi:Similar to Npc2a: NPC intracellular cholesterol transporter 2 homolog a (Drosophila melanogaster) [Cotesia congregata]|uniref:Similar to Npc2a: NPC intracellular cholesterol transporter 2 homolog a (Drosophila melanogaster) n=1 Tax=Cotesia congregata TaxID=51543 RepID=A0A8J2MQ02_COTCN|nr:Similar to Npc2a: NPC intracellular cholesterol transporter 2 homolog a (Drosophila melanogaster) [Cotesia congregata]